MTEIQKLLDKVKNFDCEPGIYRCYVSAAGWLSNYTAVANFRSTGDSGISEVSATGDTPEEALRKLLMVLETCWSKCPQCGGYRQGDL